MVMNVGMKKENVDRISVVDMRMLRWMIGKTRKYKMINDIKDNLRVALIEDKLRENRIIRFGHDMRDYNML